MLRSISFLLLPVFTMFIASCGGDDPPTPEERQMLNEVLDSAQAELIATRESNNLDFAIIPSVPDSADLFINEDGSLRLITDSVVATVDQKRARVLYRITRQIDSTTSDSSHAEDVEVLVTLRSDSTSWDNRFLYVKEVE